MKPNEKIYGEITPRVEALYSNDNQEVILLGYHYDDSRQFLERACQVYLFNSRRHLFQEFADLVNKLLPKVLEISKPDCKRAYQIIIPESDLPRSLRRIAVSL